MDSSRAATPDEMFELVSGRPTTDPSWFEFGDRVLTPFDIVEILKSRVSEPRASLIDRVLANRTDNVTVVIEGMVDLGNVGAMIRSADGFGVQSVHAIDTADAYKRSRRTSRGTDKWVDRRRWEAPDDCLGHLRNQQYTVIAADVGDHTTDMADVDLTRRIAIVFGNELEGIGERVRELAEEHLTIPMSGFADSFNVSVAASLVLHEVRRQRIDAWGHSGDMEAERSDRIKAVWYLKSVRESRLIVERAVADGYR